MDAAHAEFTERGYHDTTMAAIAERAGVAVQTVYLGFRTKSGLLEEVVGNAVLGRDRDGEIGRPDETEGFRRALAEPAGDKALALLDQGKYEEAVATAQTAVDRNPLSPEPLFELAAIQQARGQTPEAKAALIRATEVQPASSEAWRRLGQFRLDALSEPRAALKNFQAAYYLDPTNPRSWSDLIVATKAIQADGG